LLNKAEFKTNEEMLKISDKSTTEAICIKYSDNTRVAYFKDKYRDDDIMMKVLVYHEMGHCLLDLEHNDDGELHIMNSTLSIKEVYEDANWDDLVIDEFK